MGEINKDSQSSTLEMQKAINCFQEQTSRFWKNCVFSIDPALLILLSYATEGKIMSTQKLCMNIYVSLVDVVRLTAAKLPIKCEILWEEGKISLYVHNGIIFSNRNN